MPALCPVRGSRQAAPHLCGPDTLPAGLAYHACQAGRHPSLCNIDLPWQSISTISSKRHGSATSGYPGNRLQVTDLSVVQFVQLHLASRTISSRMHSDSKTTSTETANNGTGAAALCLI